MDFKEEISFSTHSKIAMLAYARESIVTHLSEDVNHTEPEFEHMGDELGVFVTLRKGINLKGCVGKIFADCSLKDSLKDMAISSATRDPRFFPVDLKEMNSISIEISVLSPFSEVKNIEEIQIGKHGLMIEHDGKRGVFLPEVALDQGWEILSFIEQLCYKAELAITVFKDDPRLLKFETIKFSDDIKQRSKK